MDRGVWSHFCNAHFFEILLIAQQSAFLQLVIILLTVCCSKNTTDPITSNLNSLSGQVSYQLCTQDSQNIWQHHFTWSLLFFNLNFPWKSHTSSLFWVHFRYLTLLNKEVVGGFLSCSGHILELYCQRYLAIHFCSFLLTIYTFFRSFCFFSCISHPCPKVSNMSCC